MSNEYSSYVNHLRKIADIMYAAGLLQWDQETYMPPKGSPIRAQQVATLSGIAHELSISVDLGKWLQELKNDASLSKEQQANIKNSLRDYSNRKKYTTEFVEKMSRTVSETFNAWQEAKQKNNFSLYEKPLEKLMELKLQECEMLGYKDHPYDAMIDQYEPGTKTAEIDLLFTDVKAQLVDFVKQVREKQNIDDSFMYKNYPEQKQWDFGLMLLRDMGYDFEAGRQDKSSHPFSISFSPNDARVTTRVDENNLSEMIWSCIHEGGHALYEQGLKIENYGLPMGEAISLAIHESQSRLWENNVGRSYAYWKYYYPKLQNVFPEQLKTISDKDFYHAMNKVEPSLIRTNADELTYHFHVMIRFEIEKALFERKIKVADLPAIWNESYKKYLDIDVPDDTRGVLQDVHWSHGSFGYFPTYSLGSFYAAQFFAKAKNDIPGLVNEIEKGNFVNLLSWLRKNIHQHGKLYTAQELCENITGEKLNFKYFLDYAREKYLG